MRSGIFATYGSAVSKAFLWCSNGRILKHWICAVLLSILSGVVFAQQDTTPTTQTVIQTQPPIELVFDQGKPLERAIHSGEVHSYRIKLSQGEYLHAVVDQRGIDLVATLLGPDGKKLLEMDSPNGDNGPEPVWLVAEETGTYRIAVSPLSANAAGRYEIRIVEIRPATNSDTVRVAGLRSFAEGVQLEGQATAESLERSLLKFNEALHAWEELGDTYRRAETLNKIGTIKTAQSHNPEAIGYFQQAARIWQQLGNQIQEAVALNNIAAIYDNLGQWDRALDAYTTALATVQRLNDRPREATLLNNMAITLSNSGRYQEAIERLESALAIRRASGDR
ncbi:MAG TPA: tetratricopeptide repeat protein, partial [Blastocatellia bacterium]|nr:tetratricopeptide repeat protein [Blastocatellia bacterium]